MGAPSLNPSKHRGLSDSDRSSLASKDVEISASASANESESDDSYHVDHTEIGTFMRTPGFKPQYKLSRIIRPTKDQPNTRWYVVWYAYDVSKEKIVRKRKFISSKFDTDRKKLNEAKRIGLLVNMRLLNGYFMDGSAFIQNPQHVVEKRAFISISNSLKESLRMKSSTAEKTYRSYKQRLKVFLQFLERNGLHRMRVKDFNRAHAKMFLNDLGTESCYSKNGRVFGQRTIDNYLIAIKALFNECVDRQEIHVNPFSKINPKDKGIGRHVAYNQQQIDRILTHCRDTDREHLAFACKFMLYTLARSSEMSRIRIGDIGRFHPDKLFIPKENAKNRVERHITLHPVIVEYFKQNCTLQLPDDWFLFSRAMRPGPNYSDYGNFGKYFRKFVLDPLRFGKEHTFYSWKHTGVVLAHKNGVPDYNIMVQGGWKSYPAFARYLKSLGLEDNQEFIDKMPLID